jgi:uncharacterized YigZ family protein
MKTIDRSYTYITEVKRSKFITHFIPINEYKGLQDRLKKAHPKAKHVVYALRRINEFDQIVENSSDDGEPKGCAGLPTLNVLRGEELINCAVLIVRYFGGIKLGTGGMARAYALSIKNLLKEEVKFILYEKQISYTFETSYSQIDKTLHTLKYLDIIEYQRDFGLSMVEWKIESSVKKLQELKTYLAKWRR